MAYKLSQLSLSVLRKNKPIVGLMFNPCRFGSDLGELGKGAGKGGGAGGSIREAGGAFGKMESAREEEYFYKQQKEQLNKLKSHYEEEVSHHEDLIKQHQQEINRHKQKISELETVDKKSK